MCWQSIISRAEAFFVPVHIRRRLVMALRNSLPKLSPLPLPERTWLIKADEAQKFI